MKNAQVTLPEPNDNAADDSENEDSSPSANAALKKRLTVAPAPDAARASLMFINFNVKTFDEVADLSLKDRMDFFMQPLPKEACMNAILERERTGLTKLNRGFVLRTKSGAVLARAKKVGGISKRPYYWISVHDAEANREVYCGKLRSDFKGKEFIAYSFGENKKVLNKSTNLFGFKSPKFMKSPRWGFKSPSSAKCVEGTVSPVRAPVKDAVTKSDALSRVSGSKEPALRGSASFGSIMTSKRESAGSRRNNSSPPNDNASRGSACSISDDENEGEGAGIREELAYIRYDTPANNPIFIQMVIPGVTDDGERIVCKPLTVIDPGLGDLVQTRSQRKCADPLVTEYTTPEAIWDGELGYFVQYFSEEVTVPSVKNFLLTDKDQVFIQFGRYDKDSFVLDFAHPLSPFQAFCAAISSLDYKICML